jgi:hypothetical protein
VRINPVLAGQIGTFSYQLKVFDGLDYSVAYAWTITVTNKAPLFTGAFSDYTLALNSDLVIDVPAFNDPEGMPVVVLVSDSMVGQLTLG